MRLLTLFIVLLLAHTRLQAQEAINLQYGNNNRFVLPLRITYLFPAFTKGVVFFRDGTKVPLLLNYNVARDEMHFLNEKGDTILLAEPVSVASIEVNQQRFFYDREVYLREIKKNEGITLAFRQDIRIEIVRKSPYSDEGYLPDNSKQAGYFTGDGQKVRLDEGRAGIVRTTTYYYFGDKYNNFIKASKAHLLRYYERQQAEVRDFIKTHHTNFDKRNDLELLMEFCGQLRQPFGQ